MGQQVTVKVLRSLREIEDFRSIWTSWNYHPNSDLDFYLTVLRTRREILRPHVIAVYRDERLDAILLGRFEHRRISLKIGYSVLFRPKVRLLTFIYGGLLGNASAGNSEVLVREIVNSLRRGEADAAMLEPLRLDSSICYYATRTPGFLSCDYLPVRQIHRIMNAYRSGEDFYRSLSSKARKNLKWQAKKLLSDYSNDVHVVCFRRTSELDRMIRDVEEIAKRTYQRRLGVGFVDDAAMRQQLQLEAKRERLAGYVLYVAGRPCAFWIGILYRGTFYSGFMGYDPSFAKYSPGMFLVTKVVEDFCNGAANMGVGRIDFGLGDAQYKEVLGNHQWEEALLYIFAPSLKGVSFNLLRTSTVLVNEVAKKIFERARLLRRIKKKWRGSTRLRTTRE